MSLAFNAVDATQRLFFAKNSSTGSESTWVMWGIIAVMFVVFYFLLIRPQKKRAEEHDSMVQQLSKGDEVITIGGIHGTVNRVKDDTVIVEVASGIKMTFSKSAIARSLTEHEPEPEPEEYEEEDFEEEEYEEEAEEDTDDEE